MSTQIIGYLDGPVIASFSHPDTIDPYTAAAFITDAITAAGGVVTTGFDPHEQFNRADPGYVAADLRIELPTGQRVWVSIECPTDTAI